MTSRDVTFLETPDKSECVKIHISEEDESASEALTDSGEERITSEESDRESRKEAELSVRRDDRGTENKSSIVDEQTAMDDLEGKESPEEVQRSKCKKRAPIWDDDPRFSVTTYLRRQVSGKTKAATDEAALTMKDPGTFEEAMSRSDA